MISNISRILAGGLLMSASYLAGQAIAAGAGAQEVAPAAQQDLRPSWVDAGLPVVDRSFLDLGASTSYGRDTAVNNIAGADSQFSSIQGRLGAARRTRTSSIALRHDATVLQFPGSNISLQQYHWTTFNLTRISSRRTTWGLNAANAYGADAARATSTVSLASVNNTPTVNDGVLAAIVTGNTLRQYASLVLDHKLSQTRVLTLGGTASFNNFLGAAASTRQFNLNATWRQNRGESMLLGVRADGVHQDFGRGTCTTASLLGFTSIRMTSALKLDGSVGPAFGSAQCTGNYQYEIIASAQSVRGSRAFIGTSRKRGNGVIAGSLWETSGYGGMQLGDPRLFTVAMNAGYTTYRGGTMTTANNDTSGYFLSAEYHRPLGLYAEWSLTARHFQRTVSSVGLARTVFFVTFTWQRQRGGPNAD